VTSLERSLGRPVAMADVKMRMVRGLADVLGFDGIREAPVPQPAS
jgi:hypothetical protein